MQIKQKTNKKIIIAVIILILIAGGIATAMIVRNNRESTNQQQVEAEKSDDESAEEDSSNTDDKTTSTSDEQNLPTTDGKTPVQYEGDNVQNSSSLTGSINTASVNNNVLTIRATINQLVSDSNGTCTINLAGPNGQTYSEQVAMIDNPQTSTCYGWDIDTSKINFTNGKWTITINLSGGGKTGTITQEVNL